MLNPYPDLMSELEIVLLGMAGAVGTLLVGQVLPWAIALQKTGRTPQLSVGKAIGGAVIVFIAVFLGGLLAHLGQPTKQMEAVALGITWQTAFAGFTGAVDAATTTKPQT